MTFFHLDDDDQHRIAREVGEKVAVLLGGKSHWDAGDEKAVIAGEFVGLPVRVRLDATFGTLWFEMKAEPPFPRIGQLHLAWDEEKKKEQPVTPPTDTFEDPTRRDDFTYFVTDKVHTGDEAPAAGFALDVLERLPDELRNDLLAALEPSHSHFTLYHAQIQLRCGGEPLGERDVVETIQRYLALLVRLDAAFRAIWQVE